MTEDKQVTAQEIYQKLLKTTKIYKDSLTDYSDEQFSYKASETLWSLGEMYEHVIMLATYSFMASVVRCLEKRKGQIGGSKNQAGNNVFFYGGLPPKKFMMPTVLESTPLVVKSKDEYINFFNKLEEDAQKLIEPVTNDEGKYKTNHPVFEWLNAYEWYYMLEMHTRHHLRQKKELESLASAI